MKLQDFLDLGELEDKIRDQGCRDSLLMAHHMAEELVDNSKDKQSIYTTYKVYDEVPELELTPRKVIEAIEAFMSYLPLKNKARFISYTYPKIK